MVGGLLICSRYVDRPAFLYISSNRVTQNVPPFSLFLQLRAQQVGAVRPIAQSGQCIC